MSVQFLPRRINAPPGGKPWQYYHGWRDGIIEWWKFYKPKRGKFRHRTECDCRYVGLKKAPKR